MSANVSYRRPKSAISIGSSARLAFVEGDTGFVALLSSRISHYVLSASPKILLGINIRFEGCAGRGRTVERDAGDVTSLMSPPTIAGGVESTVGDSAPDFLLMEL